MDNTLERQMIIGFSVGLLAMVGSAVFVFAVLTLRHQYKEKKKAEEKREQRRRRHRNRPPERDRDRDRDLSSSRDDLEAESSRTPIAIHLAYSGRSFSRQASMDSGSGPMFESYNARPLHPVNEPFYDRQSRGEIGTSSGLSVVPSSRSSPAVVPFRQSRLPNSTAHFSYDGYISHETDQVRVKGRKESSGSSSKQVRSQQVSTSSSMAAGADAFELQRRRSSDLVSTTTSTSIYRKNIWEGQQKERLYRWRITDENTSATSLPRPSVSTSQSSRYATNERSNNSLWPARRNSPSSLVGYMPDSFKNFMETSEDEEEEDDTSRSSSESSDRFHRPNVPSFVAAEYHSSTSVPYSLPDSGSNIWGYYDDVFHRPDPVRV